MKTLLYATNCSKHDTETLRYAYELSTSLDSTLIVLHVYDIPPIRVSTIRPRKLLQNAAHEENLEVLKQYCSKNLKDTVKKIVIRFEVQEDISVSEGVLTKIKELSPDLLLVGMKDEHTARGLFSGSIAKALIEKVNCPLLIVPNTLSFEPFKTVVYGSDFEENDIFALQKLVDIIEPFNAQIKVVHIPNKKEYSGKVQMEWFKEMVSQEISYWNIDFKTTNDDSPYDGLIDYIDMNQADLVALLEREDRGYLKSLFHKDLIKKMESNITIPIISFNNRKV
jgi:nucleotide-binding universal stress UspA family protein